MPPKKSPTQCTFNSDTVSPTIHSPTENEPPAQAHCGVDRAPGARVRLPSRSPNTKAVAGVPPEAPARSPLRHTQPRGRFEPAYGSRQWHHQNADLARHPAQSPLTELFPMCHLPAPVIPASRAGPGTPPEGPLSQAQQDTRQRALAHADAQPPQAGGAHEAQRTRQIGEGERGDSGAHAQRVDALPRYGHYDPRHVTAAPAPSPPHASPPRAPKEKRPRSSSSDARRVPGASSVFPRSPSSGQGGAPRGDPRAQAYQAPAAQAPPPAAHPQPAPITAPHIPSGNPRLAPQPPGPALPPPDAPHSTYSLVPAAPDPSPDANTPVRVPHRLQWLRLPAVPGGWTVAPAAQAGPWVPWHDGRTGGWMFAPPPPSPLWVPYPYAPGGWALVPPAQHGTLWVPLHGASLGWVLVPGAPADRGVVGRGARDR
ncbi:hypothetical protein HYPSUDRAFT_36162 [Hypholoma sublateritium FD-334 SS-4]|uniref:Uncharacterized protein n=1 Tax=Hypholoma sublateritium (strain FD-334 SS-4) TaxID=945553 RepID=A0A0D2MR24_HYPSF|nr:hypothetical protein HYPSUDRAFT_36162 [Hypholoma sublateritium FD-334 SS-4]